LNFTEIHRVEHDPQRTAFTHLQGKAKAIHGDPCTLEKIGMGDHEFGFTHA
jgi:hypothetical protein